MSSVKICVKNDGSELILSIFDDNLLMMNRHRSQNRSRFSPSIRNGFSGYEISLPARERNAFMTGESFPERDLSLFRSLSRSLLTPVFCPHISAHSRETMPRSTSKVRDLMMLIEMIFISFWISADLICRFQRLDNVTERPFSMFSHYF